METCSVNYAADISANSESEALPNHGRKVGLRSAVPETRYDLLEPRVEICQWFATVSAKLIQQVRDEFLMMTMLSLLCFTNLGARISPQIVATDASQTGGAVGYSDSLRAEGADFLMASRLIEQQSELNQVPVLVLSLFNGIGSSFRSYDLAVVKSMVRIAVDKNSATNRLTSHTWSGTTIIDDIHKLTLDVMKEWSRAYLRIEEIHVWAGWPCVDLAAVKANRLNLDGPNSGLVWLIPGILSNLKIAFGERIVIKHVLENVAAIDRQAALDISFEMGSTPCLVDPTGAVPMRRPRYCWTSETIDNAFLPMSR